MYAKQIGVNMNEELKLKLKEALLGKGIEEGLIEEAFTEVEEPKKEPIEEKPEAEAVEAEALEDKPLEDVPPEEVPPMDVPPVDVPPQEPQFDHEAMQRDFDELRKTNEALIARVEALEEALKGAGVIEGEKAKPIGSEKTSAPAKDPLDDGLTSFLTRANKFSY